MAFGAQLAAFHMEAGTHRFVDLAKTIAADLGTTLDKIRPYLRSWYNGARDMLEDAGISVEGMDGPDAVKVALASFDTIPLAAKLEEVENETADASGAKKTRALVDDRRGKKGSVAGDARPSVQERPLGAGDREPRPTQEYVRLLAGDLVDALKSARPRKAKKHKAVPVSLTLLPSQIDLLIAEARHGRFEHTIPATGTLTSEVQADGAWIYMVVSSCKPTDTIDLVVEEASLTVVRGTSRSTIARIDGPNGERIKRTNPRPDPRHKGMPEGTDRRLRANVPQNKIWAFSAHMAPRGKK